jgi:hypothetical protein
MEQHQATPGIRFDLLLADASGLDGAASKAARYQAIAALLERHCGGSLGVRTVEKWFERRSMPGWRLLLLFDAVAQEGRPLDPISYVERPS